MRESNRLMSLQLTTSLLLALYALAAPVPSAAFSFEVVYAYGDEPPGIPGGEFTFLRLPVINEAGQIAFTGGLRSNLGGVTPYTNRGVWGPKGVGPIGLVMQQGDTIPGVPTDTFRGDGLSAVGINDLGETAFVARPVSTGSDRGVFRWSIASSSLVSVALPGTQIPGTTPGVLYDSVNNYALNDAGIVICASPAGLGASMLLGPSGSGVTTWVEAGDPIPGAAGGSVGGACYGDGTASSNNQWAIRGLSSGPGYVAFAFSSDPTPTFDLYALEGLIPGGYSTLIQPAINANGERAYLGSSTGSWGLIGPDAGGLALRVQSGDPAPGLSGLTFGPNSPHFVLTDSGDIAMDAHLAGPGVDSTNNWAIYWMDSLGTLSLVARRGDAAPGGGNLTSPFSPIANASGDLVFSVEVDPIYSETVSETRIGVFAWSASGGLQRVLASGDSFQVAPGDVRTVRDAVVSSGAEQRRNRSGLNDSGDLVIEVTFSDFTTAILRTNTKEQTVPSVPLPILALAGACLGVFGAKLSSRKGQRSPRWPAHALKVTRDGGESG